MPRRLSRPATFALDVVAWGVVHASTGYLVHRLPAHLFEADGPVFRERGWEKGGAFYVDALRIRRWKPLLPEAGDFFAGGFDKATLREVDDAYLAVYIRETRRAEAGHWLAAVAAPLFLCFNSRPVAASMVVYGAAANGPCIAAQRYNRLRLRRVLARRAARPRSGRMADSGRREKSRLT